MEPVKLRRTHARFPGLAIAVTLGAVLVPAAGIAAHGPELSMLESTSHARPSASAQRVTEDRSRRTGAPSGERTMQVVEDPRVRRYVIPCRVVWQSPGATVENGQALLSAGRGQVTLDNGHPGVLHESGAVLGDFGRELQGGASRS
jgi:hypothetical protein